MSVCLCVSLSLCVSQQTGNRCMFLFEIFTYIHFSWCLPLPRLEGHKAVVSLTADVTVSCPGSFLVESCLMDLA